MFILIFGLIFTSQVLRKLWQRRHMLNHIPIKQVWVEDTIILIKDVQKWMHEKLLKNPMKKKTLVLYNISKDWNSKLGSPKNKRATKPN
jgi:hypothetical protein